MLDLDKVGECIMKFADGFEYLKDNLECWEVLDLFAENKKIYSVFDALSDYTLYDPFIAPIIENSIGNTLFEDENASQVDNILRRLDNEGFLQSRDCESEFPQHYALAKSYALTKKGKIFMGLDKILSYTNHKTSSQVNLLNQNTVSYFYAQKFHAQIISGDYSWDLLFEEFFSCPANRSWQNWNRTAFSNPAPEELPQFKNRFSCPN